MELVISPSSWEGRREDGMLDDDEGTWACGNRFGFSIETGMPTEFERELTADVDVDVDMEAGVDVDAGVEGGTDIDKDPKETVRSIAISLVCLVVNGGGGGSGAKLTTSGVGSSAPTSPLGTIASIISILAVSVVGDSPSSCICV